MRPDWHIGGYVFAVLVLVALVMAAGIILGNVLQMAGLG
jgi:hypothetical protein